MIVDDEPLVLEVSSLMVESLGYSVDAYPEPEQALASYSESPDAYSLAIIDMVMPAMSGKEFFIKLKAINPEIKAVISSGYQMDETDTDLVELGIKGFIDKPYTIDKLATSLNKVLNNV